MRPLPMGSVFPQLSHPLRYVAAGVQDAPDVDVVGSLHVENQERVARERPGAQAGDAQGVGVAWRACV